MLPTGPLRRWHLPLKKGEDFLSHPFLNVKRGFQASPPLEGGVATAGVVR